MRCSLRRLLASVGAALLPACGADSFAPGPLTGRWASAEHEFVATATTLTLRRPCDRMWAPGPLVVDGEGHFAATVEATWATMAGDTLPIRLMGHFRGDTLYLTSLAADEDPRLYVLLRNGVRERDSWPCPT